MKLQRIFKDSQCILAGLGHYNMIKADLVCTAVIPMCKNINIILYLKSSTIGADIHAPFGVTMAPMSCIMMDKLHCQRR